MANDPISVIENPTQMLSLKKSGKLMHVNMPYNSIRHADNLRSIKYFHSGKVVMKFRIGSYKTSSVNGEWWFYILNGLK